MTQLNERDKEMLKLLSEMELPLVASRLDMKPGAIYSRLAWLRKKKTENQTFLNQLYGFERTAPRIKKLLTPGDLKEAAAQ